MTSIVKVTAHCSQTKEVVVVVNDGGVKNEYLSKVLQDGESCDVYIYDSRSVNTYEQNKS